MPGKSRSRPAVERCLPLHWGTRARRSKCCFLMAHASSAFSRRRARFPTSRRVAGVAESGVSGFCRARRVKGRIALHQPAFSKGPGQIAVQSVSVLARGSQPRDPGCRGAVSERTALRGLSRPSQSRPSGTPPRPRVRERREAAARSRSDQNTREAEPRRSCRAS